MGKRVLVTGGAGFIGSHLAERLIKAKYNTYIIDDLSGGLEENIPDGATLFKCDLRDKEKTESIISKIKPEIVFHLAANAAENKAQFSPVDITSRNWNTFINTLVPALKCGMKRIVVTSSIAVYGIGQTPFKETARPEPEDLYGWSKFMMEESLKILSKVHGFEYVITRPHNVYGPKQNMRDPYRNVVTIFMNSILKGEPYYIYGDGEQRRCFSYINDVVDALYKCGFLEVSGMTFNVGSDKNYSVNELSNIILKTAKSDIRPIYIADRPQEVKIAISDHKLARRFLAYEDKTSIKEGIYQTWNYVKKMGYQTPVYEEVEIESDSLPQNWKTNKNSKFEVIETFDGLPIAKIISEVETPSLVMGAEKIKQNYNQFLKSFSSHYKSSIFFSVNTNNELQILKLLRRLGANAQISSGMELELCKFAGFSPNQIIYDGPCKNIDELETAFRSGIFAYNADSFTDIQKANEIGKKLKKRVNVGLRISPHIKGHSAKTVEFYISKFGMTPENAIKTIKQVSKYKHIKFIGLHAHIGSQVLDIDPFLRCIDDLFSMANKLRERGINLKYLDFGGGIPSPSLTTYSPLQMFFKNLLGLKLKNKVKPMTYYGDLISERIKENINKYNFKNLKIIFEPGRAIVSDAGVALSKVISIKDNWVFLDASITFIPENVFFTERDILATHNSKEEAYYNIAGSSLLAPDFFSRRKLLPKLKEGDIVAICDCGAYTLSRSIHFTTLRPPVYMIENGKINIIRKKDTYETFIGPMVK